MRILVKRRKWEKTESKVNVHHTDTVLMHTTLTLSHGQVPGNHGQEIESVIAEMMSGQGHDGVKIYWEEEKDF